MASIAPFWDGNETWLVVIGAGLFAAFPDAYAVLLSAFYFPVLLMLFGLIFRGIAFEFRYRSERMRPVWDWGFFVGSAVVAFVQGAAIGAMIRGIPNSLFTHGRERCSTGSLITIPVLRRHHRPTGHCPLHHRCLLGVPRQSGHEL